MSGEVEDALNKYWAYGQLLAGLTAAIVGADPELAQALRSRLEHSPNAAIRIWPPGSFDRSAARQAFAIFVASVDAVGLDEILAWRRQDPLSVITLWSCHAPLSESNARILEKNDIKTIRRHPTAEDVLGEIKSTFSIGFRQDVDRREKKGRKPS